MHRKTAKINFYNNTKDTFEKHLIESLKPYFYMEIQDNYKDICKNTKTKKNIPIEFQTLMKSFKDGNKENLTRCCTRIYSKLPCKNYVRKLVEAVLLTNNKILTLSATITGVNTEIVVPDVPSMEIFLMKCLSEIGKMFHRNPYLLCNDNEASSKRLSALNESITLIEMCIKNTINGLVPYGTILDVYLNTIKNDNETYEEEEPKEEEESDNESVMSEEDNESVASELESEYSNDEGDKEEDNESVMSEEDNESVMSEDMKSEHSQHSNNDEESEHKVINTNSMPVEEETNIIQENNFEKDEVLSTGDDIPDELNIITYQEELDEIVEPEEKQENINNSGNKEENKVINISSEEKPTFSFGFAKGATNDI